MAAGAEQVERARRQRKVRGHRSTTCRRYSRRSLPNSKKKKKNVLTLCIQLEMMPTTFVLAMEFSDSSKRRTACDSEIQSLCKNKTWELVSLLHGRKAIRRKWVFKVKETVNGLIERYKARLVAKGFLQKHGVDFEGITPVVKLASIRIILSIAAQYKLVLHHMGVKTAFLNGLLDKEIS